MSVESSIQKSLVNFLANETLCVIATIHKDKIAPESAVVAFAENDKFEIIIGTSNVSRKYKNLKNNSNVSLVIGWDSNKGTIQYEGHARELNPDERMHYAKLQIKKNPAAEKFIDRPDQRYFLIAPNWIRFTDNQGNPPGIHEIYFN